MFEKYTEKARRVIFFARYEASQFGTHAIEPEHLLLGLLREAEDLFAKLLPDSASVIASIRKEIEASLPSSQKVPASVDLPLSQSAKRVLNLAAVLNEERDHRHIGTEHLLAALIEEGQSLASRVLKDRTQLRSGAELLERKEVITHQEFGNELAGSHTTPYVGAMLGSLLNLLVRKGIITEEERREVLGRGE